MSTHNKKHGVILMTYGSATTENQVEAYFHHIYGENVSAATIEEFKRRYRLIGRSPLIDITEQQANALEEKLGDGYVVRAGMRHSAPTIDDAVRACKATGAEDLRGIILSPHYAASLMRGYDDAFQHAAETHGFAEARIASPWPTEPHFIALLASRVQGALSELQKTHETIAVICTTHSMPKRVIDADPTYLEQLAATTNALQERLGPAVHCYSAYQSAGHSPEPWLTPDLADTVRERAAAGATAALIVPIQFIADHLEVLYDLDIAARAQCASCGIAYARIALPNTHPAFIDSLKSIVCSD